MSEKTHETWMRLAIKLSELAVEHGNHPFGALLVKDGNVILTAENTVNTGHDVTNHAEMNLVRMAGQQYEPEVLKDCILYTSTEPCPMCTGAIYWAEIGTVVFGCSEDKLYEITGGGSFVPCRAILEKGHHPVAVIGPILEEDALRVHSKFW